MRLAVVTHDPHAVAETYVRHHIRALAPGTTCLVHRQGYGLDGIPSFHLPDRGGVGIWPGKLLQLLRFGNSSVPLGNQRRRLVHFLKEQQVEAVYAEFGPNGALMWPICKELNIPLLVHFHGFDATVMPKRWKIRWAYRRMRPNVSALLCGSRHFKQVVHGLGFDLQRIHVIPCGIEASEFRQGSRSGTTIAAVGRLTPKKAPQLSIEAFALALERCPELRLEIVGDGPLHALCAERIQALGLSHKVMLHGAQDPGFIKALLERSDLFIQHSVVAPNGDTESQGISLIEAMAAGLPVVCTDHNGFSESNLEGVTGYLVPEGDVHQMADRICDLMEDPDARQRMGKAAQEHVRAHFDHEIVDARLRALLLHTIESYER